jgi:tRNA modification GTPase
LEANIDFASEDIEVASAQELTARMERLQTTTRELLNSFRQGRIVREGFQIALVGRPNAGKSSLLNALVGEERAIVHSVPGTTRDFVEASLVVNGLRVNLVDTAGLRFTDDPVEKIGVERSLAKIHDVDMVWYIADASTGITATESEFFNRIPWNRTLLLMNKVDLQPDFKMDSGLHPLATLGVSATAGEGLESLKQWLQQRLAQEISEDSTVVSNARHFKLLHTLADSLEKSIPLVVNNESPDLIALELQTGMNALYEILGRTYDDQVMDRVFNEFCLGK